MEIKDSILKRALQNVYFIWGRGKTTIANRLREKHGFYVYSTDDSRDWHMDNAIPEDQPYMCRDYESEYGVRMFWELPPAVIAEREVHFLKEFTPMVVADLIALSKVHGVIICEGDIDYRLIALVATHAVYLKNRGKGIDFFNRPDHIDELNYIKSRHDLSEEEKEAVIENAYRAVSGDESNLPDWVTELDIHSISWDESIAVEETVKDVEEYFGFDK